MGEWVGKARRGVGLAGRGRVRDLNPGSGCTTLQSAPRGFDPDTAPPSILSPTTPASTAAGSTPRGCGDPHRQHAQRQPRHRPGRRALEQRHPDGDEQHDQRQSLRWRRRRRLDLRQRTSHVRYSEAPTLTGSAGALVHVLLWCLVSGRGDIGGCGAGSGGALGARGDRRRSPSPGRSPRAGSAATGHRADPTGCSPPSPWPRRPAPPPARA